MKKIDPATKVHAPTRPGRDGKDEVSRPGDGTDLVIALSEIMKVERSVAHDVLTQAMRDVGQSADSGWSPGALMHLYLLELAVTAHQSQLDWRSLRGFTAEHLGAYFDAVGRHFDRHGESREAREKTRGHLVGVH